jgi:hypothetical protein
MLLHILASLPRAGEGTRGYLHGGVVVDFVGQKPPTSKSGLLLLDLVILAIQCFMLAVHTEREKLRKIILPSRRIGGDGADGNSATTQNYDAEERGVLQDSHDAADETGGIEMRTILQSNGHDHRRSSQEGLNPPGEESSRGNGKTDLLDILRSGNAILGDFHVLHAIRTAGDDYQATAAYSLRTLGYRVVETTARLEARRRQEQG